MSELTERLKDNFKGSAMQLTIFLVRLLTGSFLGITIAVCMQTMHQISMFLFMFIVVATTGIILRLTRYWSLLAAIILLLVLTLIGVLLKLYIHTAATM
jgi:hypothetical protein